MVIIEKQDYTSCIIYYIMYFINYRRQLIKSLTSYSLLLVGVFFLATSAVFVKLANAPSAIIAFYRLGITSAILIPIVLFNKNMRKEILSLSKRQIILTIISGMVLAVHYVLWFESMIYTSVASATVLVTLQPVFAVVGCYYLYHERLSKRSVLGIVIAIIGSTIIGWGDFQLGGQAFYGDILALISAVVITIYFLIGQSVRKNVSVLTYSMLGYLSSSVFLLFYGVNQNLPFIGYSQSTWLMFICLALLSTLLGQMVLNWVIKWLSTSVVSVGILSETIWAVLLSYLILNEKLTMIQGIGIAIILVGLIYFSVYNKPVDENIQFKECA